MIFWNQQSVTLIIVINVSKFYYCRLVGYKFHVSLSISHENSKEITRLCAWLTIDFMFFQFRRIYSYNLIERNLWIGSKILSIVCQLNYANPREGLKRSQTFEIRLPMQNVNFRTCKNKISNGRTQSKLTLHLSPKIQILQTIEWDKI